MPAQQLCFIWTQEVTQKKNSCTSLFFSVPAIRPTHNFPMQHNTCDGNFHGNKNTFFHTTHRKWSMFELILGLVHIRVILQYALLQKMLS